MVKIHINCAASLDGKIAGKDRKQTRISSVEDMARVHHLRSSHDAVLVGVGTVLSDDPKLTVKEKFVNNPTQPATVVIDPNGRSFPKAQVFKAKKSYLAMSDTAKVPEGILEHVQILRCGAPFSLEKMLELLKEWKIMSILVEGGGKTIWYFLSKGLASTMTVYMGPIVIGGKDAPSICDGDGFLNDHLVRGRLVFVERLGEGIVLGYEF
ncbi:MAG TPA: diaminohydroxyphosphoribosylaminopyrimidine reductase [Euryarchaeota archaeon]|nr:diaminohydroxyphosphoribosylaminopyrimidine reductase [Euryarchaeota archaeon]